MRLLSIVTVILSISDAWATDIALPPGLIDLRSPEGQAIFLRAEARAAFWPLSAQFLTQKTPAFCGVASVVMVLNSLELPAPVTKDYAPYAAFTQDDVFDAGGTDVISADRVAHHGMTLDQVGALAAHFGTTVQVVHATDDGLNRFRQAAAQALATDGHYVLVNFARNALAEVGYGHISPLAAYDSTSDRFLMLDVARYKYPPAWVRTADLYAALNTLDAAADNATRGYVLLTRPPASP